MILRPFGLTLSLLLAAGIVTADNNTCAIAGDDSKQVFWGDLHVHTAYSLDAYGYGTVHTPAEAFRFAQGEPLILPGGATAQLDRPLDFMAITDHAEWLDFLHICTDPGQSAHPTCQTLRKHSNPEGGSKVFGDFVVPSITREAPAALPPCEENPELCKTAGLAQWQRIQTQANAANKPCTFTALLGYEWSATRSFSHTHRNVIFRSDAVTATAIDYIRYPTLKDLFTELDRQCQKTDGCEALTIPHNTNMSDGASFDVLSEDADLRRMRAHYERLIEVHQEKGNSECLAPLGATDESDCNLEIQLTRHSRPAKPADYTPEEWEHMRAGYVRGLLLRGLEAAAMERDSQDSSSESALKLGMVGATDTHAATPGFVDEALWQGSVFGIGSLERNMTRLGWNPGGLTAVWASQNTRGEIFDALHRREVYATSGPRIRLRFDAGIRKGRDKAALTCNEITDADVPVVMGGDIKPARGKPLFRIQALADRNPIARIEIVRGTVLDGKPQQQVIGVWEGTARDVCAVWRDADYDRNAPTFWYARVQEVESPRWSALMCRKAGRCEEFPGADQLIRERAWSSPVWSLP